MKVLKFGEVGCPGCVIMKPRWQEIETENPWLKTEYYDLEQDKEIVQKYNLTAMPTFVFLDKEDKEFLRLSGEVEKDKLIEIINQNRNK